MEETRTVNTFENRRKRYMDHDPYHDFHAFFDALEDPTSMAWTIVYNNYGSILRAGLHRKGYSRQDSRDLLHDVVERLFKIFQDEKRKKMKGFNEKAFTSYMFTIAINIKRDDARKLLKSILPFDEVQEEISDDFWLHIEKMLEEHPEEAERIYDWLDDAIDKIQNQKHANIFRGRYIDHMEIDELAEKFGETRNNIRVILCRQRNFIISLADPDNPIA